MVNLFCPYSKRFWTKKAWFIAPKLRFLGYHRLCEQYRLFAVTIRSVSTPFKQLPKLFALRKRFPELVEGAIQLDRIQCSNKQIFSGLRSLSASPVIALVSFSDQSETAIITLDRSVNVRSGSPLTLTDTQTGKPVVMTSVSVNTFTVTLQPFQGVVGRLIR